MPIRLNCGTVLVQSEMENWRSPLASIPPLSVPNDGAPGWQGHLGPRGHPRVDARSSLRETRGATGYERNNLCVLLRAHQQRRRAVGTKIEDFLGSGRYFEARDSTSSSRNRTCGCRWATYSATQPLAAIRIQTSCQLGMLSATALTIPHSFKGARIRTKT
jgi:hypothetical protein